MFSESFKVPEGHHPRGTTLRELSEEVCLSEGSAGVFQRALRGLSEGSAGSLPGSAGVRGIFRGFSGVVTLMLVTLGNCSRESAAPANNLGTRLKSPGPSEV